MTTARVGSYAARRGRNSALTQERMRVHFPRRVIPQGPMLATQAFGSDVPLVLDVGCGHGAAAIAYAAAHPDQGIVAVDVHTPGLARMMAAAERAGVDNLRVWHGDAVPLLEERILPHSLHSVHLFFPDPWPKARHVKRRFVTAYTLDLVHDRLEAGGTLRVATDQDFYADHVLAQLVAHGGFDVVTGERPPWRPTDGFEDKGLAAGRAITEIAARPRGM
jgi:tRNA (guanine-N7-)-methyltransferase